MSAVRTHAYSNGLEIWEYCKRCVTKYDLGKHIQFDTVVTRVSFDGEHWHVQTKNGHPYVADLVVSGPGGLHMPNHADIPGLDSFDGAVFHTAEWNHFPRSLP